MKTSSAKAKGRKLQQWVRDKILYYYGDLTPLDVRSTSMGAGGEDVTLSRAAVEAFPYAIECKSLARFVGYAYYEQAVSHALDSEHDVHPVVFIKANQKKPLVILDAEQFFILTGRSYEWKRQG